MPDVAQDRTAFTFPATQCNCTEERNTSTGLLQLMIPRTACDCPGFGLLQCESKNPHFEKIPTGRQFHFAPDIKTTFWGWDPKRDEDLVFPT